MSIFYDCLLYNLASFRLVLNIEGEEIVPSDQWTFTPLQIRKRNAYNSPIDLTYQRAVSVMSVQSALESNVKIKKTPEFLCQ